MNKDVLPSRSHAGATRFRGRGFVQNFEKLINALPEQIALVDEKWTILAVNPAWTRTASLYGYDELRPGSNYAAFCKARAEEGHNAARPAVEGIAEIDAGRRSSFHYFYDGNDRWEGHTFHLTINQLSIEGRTLATITRNDISELIQLRRERERATYSLLELQSEERRRFAREIHDSTQQLLVSVALGLGQLRRSVTIKQARSVIGDLEQLLDELQREIRSISYLSHPPSLETLGLARALEDLVAGFGRRTGLVTSFQLQATEMLEWPAAVTAIYRIAQEALSNVYRHACATRVDVGLYCRKSMIHLVMADDGSGMPTSVLFGVGLTGMKARLSELGGRLFVRSLPVGTTLIASVPRRSQIRPSGDLAVH